MSANREHAFRPGSFWSLFESWTGWIFFFALLACWALAVSLQYKLTEEYHRKPWTETFILPRPEYVEKMAIGYNAWLSDFLYLRAIQALGGVYRSAEDGDRAFDPVFNYFNVISSLDPHFIEAYVFGNLVMGDEGGRQDLALAYLDLGQRNNWRAYQPWYEAAFIWLWSIRSEEQVREEAGGDSWLWKMTWPLSHTDKSRFLVRQAAKSPDAPGWVSRWETHAFEKAGEYRVAVQRWIQTYAEGVESHQEFLCGIAVRKTQTAIHEWHKQIMQEAADTFYEERGRRAADLEELARAGYLTDVEVVDHDLLIAILSAMRERSEPISPRLEEIFEAALVRKTGILPGLDEPGDYFVLLHHPEMEQGMVVTESERQRFTSQALIMYRGALEDYFAEHGNYPQSVDDFAIPQWGMIVPDPYGRGWEYNPETGEIHSIDRPNL